MQQPTVGRIVHFTPPFPALGKTDIPPQAAIVVNVARDDVVDLLVWGPNRDERVRAVRFDPDGAPRSWNWPARA
ncbi:hypothetical protein M1M07_07640 [Rhodococcus sp. HM1]|uniref:hypothetical protein n=1 Tax=Rhodococcus sp. HM1 TaxID=2937759 RepID=UPI002009E662|nr:hypothetical protein [Rhodococcus sp. HM1]MCK8670989.1 hypothetical protein [Rhodococcus sp. HM1]